ncbi:hypothetical protein GOP47_0026925 [Adiantum capillus-veneris]|nr:hypothetical protein GOP47_0026925 [Adiantum capillus-veneris]
MAGAGIGAAARLTTMMMMLMYSVQGALASAREWSVQEEIAGKQESILHTKLARKLQEGTITWPFYIGIGFAAVASVVGIMVALDAMAVCIVWALGFRSQGIAAGSRAAAMMSTYGGNVEAGSVVANFQSVGALGVAGVSTCGRVAVMLCLVLAVGLIIYFVGIKVLVHADDDGSGSTISMELM